MSSVLTGLDHICRDRRIDLKGSRIGLLCNQASVDRDLNPARDVINRCYPGQLKALFGPQHGYGGEDQDNMVETGHTLDRALNIPVFSLYSETREPLPHMLEAIDVLFIDLQDVGTRVYTFASTMLNCLRAAAATGKRVLVLDRPNPLGGDMVEGNVLKSGFHSFVGPLEMPMRHGMTMGELAGMFNDTFGLGCNLEVVPLRGWRRNMRWEDTGLRWIMPSVNMPSPLTAAVYPGQVIWEGTNLSEGRGTCRPFEIFGAPYLDPEAVKKRVEPEALTGCFLQQYSFRPTFHKWEGALCRGFLIHVLDPNRYQPYFTSLALLEAILKIHGGEFEWKSPPYEYEFDRQPFDLITGDPELRQRLESGEPACVIRDSWQTELESFVQRRKAYLLYS